MPNLEHLIEPTIRRNIQSIPFEGDNIDVNTISEELNEFINGLLKGFGTFVLKNFTVTDKGWKHNDGNVYSREDAIKLFIRKSNLR